MSSDNNSNAGSNEADNDEAILSSTLSPEKYNRENVNQHPITDACSVSATTSISNSGAINNLNNINNNNDNSIVSGGLLPTTNGTVRNINNLTASGIITSQIRDMSYLSTKEHHLQQSNDWAVSCVTREDIIERMNDSPLSTSPLSSSSSPSSSSASTSSSELNPSDALQSPLTGLLNFEGFSMPQIGTFGYSLPSLANFSANLDMPNFAELASLPTLPFNMPNLTNLQNLANLPNFSNLPNLTNFPNLPNLPNLARFRPANFRNLPTLTQLPIFSASFARNSLLKPWSHLMESVRNMHKRLNDITQRYPTNFHFKEWRASDDTPYIRIYFILNDALYYCDSNMNENTTSMNNKSYVINHRIDKNTSIGSKDASKEGHHSSNKFRSNRNIHHYHQLDIKNLHIQLPHPTSLLPTNHDMVGCARRLQSTSSIANYEYDTKSSRFVFSLGINLYCFNDHPGGQPPSNEPPHIPVRLKTDHPFPKSQPQICPSNADLIAFYCDGDLWCTNIKTGQEVRLTDSISSAMNLNRNNPFLANGLVTNSNRQQPYVSFHRPSPTALDSSPILIGRPSHVIQEEFKRNESFWWRHDGEYHVVVGCSDEYSEYELLYEETDQSMVDIVGIPSWDGQIEEYRYPRTGTNNAVSKLRLVRFKLSNSDYRIYDISQSDLPVEFKEVYPEYEYLVRVGWLSQDAIWCQMLNRHQTNLVLVVISLSNSFRPQILYEDKCDKYWINVHDIIHFLNVSKIDCQPLAKGSELTFVWSNEETGHRHLYLIRAQLTGDDMSCCQMETTVEDHDDALDNNSGIIDVDIDAQNCSAISIWRPTSSIVRMDEGACLDSSRTKTCAPICANGANTKNSNKSKYPCSESSSKRSKQSQLKSRIIFKKQLTFGEWEVSEKEFWVDENEMLIYFCGLRETPLEKQLYVLSYADYLLQTNVRASNSSDVPSTSSSYSTNGSRHTKIRRLTESNFSHSYIAFNENCNVFINIQSNISIPPFGFVNRICRPEKALEHNSSGQKLTPNQAIKLSHLPDSKRLAMLLVNSINYPSSCVLDNMVASATASNNHGGKHRKLNYLKAIGPRRQSNLLDCEADQIDLLPGLAKPELFSYKLSSGDIVYGFIFKPEFMESGMRYPTVLEVYGGPEIQQVSNNFMSVRQPKRHLLSSEGYVVVSFDCRGSSHRGLSFEAHVYKRMGQVEVNDQVEVLQWLSKNTGYIDLNRIAIQGWSYGGYLSLMALAQRPDIFKIAIAGAPVTNWFLYDTGYTERFMDLPSTNVDGYNKGNVSNYASQFPNEENRLLLLHGLMDENVHFAHTVSFVQALIRAGKPYSLQVYPEERHSLRHSKSGEHFETYILSYLQLYL